MYIDNNEDKIVMKIQLSSTFYAYVVAKEIKIDAGKVRIVRIHKTYLIYLLLFPSLQGNVIINLKF